jgi:hypothetical protein
LNKNIGQDQKANETRNLPPCEQQHLVAVHADQLFGRQVCQRNRPCDEQPCEPAACKEHLFGGTCVLRPLGTLAVHFPVSEDGDEHGERNKYADLRRAVGCLEHPPPDDFRCKAMLLLF